MLGPGCGDNAGAALGLGLRPGQTLVSVGTSGVVASVSTVHTADPSGIVAGFADASGHHLPLACTLNGARVLDTTAGLLGVDHDGLDALALSAGAGAGGLVLVPYLEGERTPNVPGARGQAHGVTSSNLTRENLARAAVEGLAGLLGQAIDGMRAQGVLVDAVTVTGGGARSEAFRRIAPTMWGLPVDVPDPAEDVALGAARQAAWVLPSAVGGLGTRAGSGGLVEVVLDRRHLPGAPDGVPGLHRDLGAVERRAAGVGHQLEPGLSCRLLEDPGRRLPLLVGAHELVLGLVPGRELEVEVVEPEVAQQAEDEAQEVLDLLTCLFGSAVGVGVVLVIPRTRVNPCTTPDFSNR